MQGIREKRKIVFSGIQLSESTIQAIADMVFQEFNNIQDIEKAEAFLLFSLDTNSNTAFESSSPEIYKNTEILNGNRIVKINMKFNSKDFMKSIEFQCVETLNKESLENYLYVSGDDSNWVNGIVSRLNLMISNSEKPPKINKYLSFLSLTTIILFNYVFFKLFLKYLEMINIDWLRSILVMGPPLLSLIYISKLFTYLENLWPMIEINLGQQRIKSYSDRRTRFYWIVSAIFVPLILGFVYDILKSLI